MFKLSHWRKPKLSIVVAFYNMQREAKRTLFSLTTKYQAGISESDYEVIAIDSNSPEPLPAEWVESLQKNFKYHFVTTDSPSPCHAMNTGIRMARANHVVCMIDGARILSPGILSNMIQILKLYEEPFIQTLAMHIGHEIQNIAVEKGYNQSVEDDLIASTNWETDGYQLFDISCLAGSSRNGYLYPVPECNCFCISRRKLIEIGGFDERFRSPGGGIVNHDVLNQLLSDEAVTPVMLLGEASFHQFHGGVATNVPASKHPKQIFKREYQEIRGKEYKAVQRNATLFGIANRKSLRFVITDVKTKRVNHK